MNNDKRNYVTRDGILKLLSDVEVAKVSAAETAERLTEGDEYIDLEHLEEGVLVAGTTATPMGSLLPRKVVHGDTWMRILFELAAR
jgi:hypothetical protein